MSKFAKTGKPRRPIGPVTAASPPSPGVYVLGGLTDASFSVINHLEAGRDAAWPWMVTA